MRNLKTLALLIMALLFASTVSADNLTQNFEGWPPSPSSGQSDGWTYSGMGREGTATGVFNGTYAAYLNTSGTAAQASWAKLISPGKEGGVGLITFWARMRYASNLAEVKLNVYTSEDGETFGDPVETVLIPSTAATYTQYVRYSIMVNDADAKYVRFDLPNSMSYSTENAYLYVTLDEIIITDNPGANLSHSFDITGELNVAKATSIHLQGTAVTSDVTFTLSEGSAFSLGASPNVTLTPAQLNAGYDLDIQFTPTVADVMKANLIATGNQFPGLILPISGTGLYRNIAEGFNETISTSNGTYSYLGWQIKNGSRSDKPMYFLHGAGALNIYESLISPPKVGGMGEISFWYRALSPVIPVEFTVYNSADGTSWTEMDKITASGTEYLNYHKVINNAGIQYIKVEITDPVNTKMLLIDNFVITENGKAISRAVAGKTNFEFATPGIAESVIRNVPITFSSITEDVTITSDQASFSFNPAPILQANANGEYLLPVLLLTAATADFVTGNITISGGGLDFPLTIPVNFYLEQTSLYSDFDAEWGTTSVTNYYTDKGWAVLNGCRYTTQLAYFGGVAHVQLNANSSLITRPLKSGVGSIQYFSKLASAGNTVNVHVMVSADGINWTEKEVLFMNSNSYDAYEVVINDATAKYVRLDTESLTTYTPYVYIDNFTVTGYGTALSKLTLEEEPYFEATKAAPVTVNVKIAGENITSDLQVSMKSGTEFSLNDLTSVPAADINGKTYSLPVKFTPVENNFVRDTIVITGSNFNFDQTIPISGYHMKDLLFEGFEVAHTAVEGVSYTYMINGWTSYQGTRGTTSSYLYEGTGYMQLPVTTTATPTLMSPPKSGGVGTIQFYYRNNTNNSMPVIEVRTYKSLTDTPTVVKSVVAAYATEYTLFEAEVNSADAKYVEITLNRGETTITSVINVYFDNVIITANGKLIPEIIAVPESLSMKGYEDEPVSDEFEFEFNNIEKEVVLSMQVGSNFTLEPTVVAPSEGTAKASVKITYMPESDGSYSADTLLIKSDGLPQTLKVPVGGLVLNHTIYEDFISMWGAGTSTIGTFMVNGWKVADARRATSGQYFVTTAGAQLCLSNNATTPYNGTLYSPEKIQGIDSIKMGYHMSNNSITMIIETSEDGDVWNIEKEIPYSTTGKITLEEEINNETARFLRVRGTTTSTSTVYLTIDNIEVTGLPYLRQVGGNLETIDTHVSPLEIPIVLTGILEEEAILTMSAGEYSSFTLSKSVITPAELEESGSTTLTLTFNATESGTYEEAIFITPEDNTEKYYAIIPVTVIYNKPYISLAGTVDEVQTNEVPYTIPVSLEGLILEDVTISIDGADADKFTLSATSITPEDMEGGFDFNVAFDAEVSGEYNATVHVGSYLDIPVKVTYAKPYVTLLADVEPVNTNTVPVTIPISVGGLAVNDLSIAIEAYAIGSFELSKTTLTAAEINEGANFDVTFTWTDSGEFHANVVISDENTVYLSIPLSINYLKPYVELAEPLNPVQASGSPVVIPVSVKGFILEDAVISLTGDKASYFELSSATVTPAELEAGNYNFSLVFNSMEPGDYTIDIHIADKAGVDYVVIPLTVNYSAPYTNGEILLASCDFETNESFMNWKNYDLDGMVLSIFFSQAKPWYWAYELQTEVPESNSVMAATSMFSSNEPDYITPANDWLFSMPLEIPAQGSYGAAWEARSLMADWLETYEIRVIEDGVLTELEDEFNTNEPSLGEVSDTLIANSSLMYTVNKENAVWTERKVNLDAYKGKTIRVIWRYISAEQHTLYIDNFKFYSEILGTHIASTPDMIYTQAPEFALQGHSPAVQVVVNNGGTQAIANAKIVVSINDADDNELYSETTDIASFQANTPTTIATENGYDALAGPHYYTVEVSGDGYKNAIASALFGGFEVTERTYALDNGDVTGGVYSSSQGFKVGQKFPIEVDSYLKSITFALTSSTTATSVNIGVYELVNNNPVLKYTQQGVAVNAYEEKVYTAELSNEVKMEAGKVYFVAFEQTYGEELYLGRTSNEVGPIAAFYTTNNAGWSWLGSDHTLYIRLNADAWSTGINRVSDSNMQVYVSADGMLHIKNAKAGDRFMIYDTQGKMLVDNKVKSADDVFDLSLTKGVYLVRLNNVSYKIIK